MNVNQPHVSICIDVPLEIGESPLWDEDRRVLWFVDINAPAIYMFDPQVSLLEKFELPSLVGSIGLTGDDRLVVAMKSGVHLFNPNTRKLEFLVNPEADRPNNRLNDGKVGPDGCFWVGSMDESSAASTGALYRVTSEGEVTRVLDNLFISNGLAWSPDGNTMYHTDGLSTSIKAYDFDLANGILSNERIFASLDHEEFGWPDGGTTDIDGNYWSAGIFKGKVNQISPQGQLIRSIQMPVLTTTMPCIGGDNGTTLFVTSLAAEIDDERQEGTLLSCEIDVQAGPVFKFGQKKSIRLS